MTRAIVIVCAVAVWSAALEAAPPVQGRLACAGYDVTATFPGDLVSPTGSGVGLDNGILFVFTTRAGSVRYHPSVNVWQATVDINGADVPVVVPGDQCFYYPEVLGSEPDGHAWYAGTPAAGLTLGAGILYCQGYDGFLHVPGDVYGGKPRDGILFGLPIADVHLMPPGLIHGRMSLVSNHVGVAEDVWVVFPTSMCGVQ